MSGGHFGPSIKYRLEEINDELQRIIDINDSDERDEHGDLKSYQLSKKAVTFFRASMAEFKCAGELFKTIDYFLSGDYGEDNMLNESTKAAEIKMKKMEKVFSE